ncbi:unnamed protein product [Oppiella nova]|uniref:Uncharacterized protein n=1 Tax=Oppiella nova TaxID=334625 RepID=A0A7R9LKR2_9ACAR|nr:unnamed protein product [Oppiella nova]CAG2163947.1 unnamed protein product [Oppiella nova]
MKLNEDFIKIESKTLKTHLLDPTELYINENGNYIIYETIGSYFICAMDISRPNTYGLTSTHILPNTLRANSKLSIDWIHDLFYWIKDKKQILVSEFASLHQPIVFANKVFDSITTLAVNPIDSLVIWVEFDSEYNEYLLQKTSQDGSNRTQIYKFKLLIKTLDFDYQLKRIYYLSAFELSSIAYDGTGRRVLVPEANAIFQFEIFRNHLYWIEYSDNKLFRSHLTQPSSAHQVFNLNNTVNRFEITGPGRQPFNINRCFMANCTDLCLPVDHQYYRCVCQQAIGGTILITGLLIGAVIAAIVIRIYTKPDGKQVYDISPNNTVATDWDSVRFKKSEQNIYFGKFLVKDEYY